MEVYPRPVFGPVGGGKPIQYPRPANPWVAQSVAIGQSKLTRSRTVTATVAGRPHIGCCGDCAADFRSK
jgi:hypothetical protein